MTITKDKKMEELMAKFNELLGMENEGDDPTTVMGQVLEAMEFATEEGEDPAIFDILCHFMCFHWKVVLALLPPAQNCKGFALFWSSMAVIGILTAVVGDIAKIFGCTLGVSDILTAITFVALGTSLPDTFASMTAATQDEYADAAIGNVTGSNSVNVFLGLGIPWTIGSIYHAANGQTDPRDLNGWCESVHSAMVPPGTKGV